MGTDNDDPALQDTAVTTCASNPLCEERMSAIEERLAQAEPVIARVPAVESRIQRMERLMLELQGGMRRIEKATDEHQRRIEAKLEDIVQLIRQSQARAQK